MTGTYGVNAQQSMPVVDGGANHVLAEGANMAGQQSQPQEQSLMSRFSPNGNAEKMFLGNQLANIGSQMSNRGSMNAILGVYGKKQLPANQNESIVNQLGKASLALDAQKDKAAAQKASAERYNQQSQVMEALLKQFEDSRNIARQPFATGIYGGRG